MAPAMNTDMSESTSIRVSERLADELYSRKGRGESYEDVIWELIERADAFEEESSDGSENNDDGD